MAAGLEEPPADDARESAEKLPSDRPSCVMRRRGLPYPHNRLKEASRRGIVSPLYTRVHTERLPFLQDITDSMRNGMKRISPFMHKKVPSSPGSTVWVRCGSVPI